MPYIFYKNVPDMYLSTHIHTYIHIYTCLCIHARLNPHPKIQFSSFISRFIAMLTICHLPSATDQKRTSRRELRSLCFCEFSTWAMHKIDNSYRVSVFTLQKPSSILVVFAWLWGYEPMFSIHVQHTRLKKNNFFLSQHVGAKSASLFNVFALPQFVRQTNANT